MKKTKILVAGIGGVGGYFGGLLARHYVQHEQVQVYFLARGTHLQAIRQNGLTVIGRNGEFIAHPFLATDNAAETGTADMILVCSKSYHLETLVPQLAPCIGPNTVIIPFLNGAGSKEKIEQLLPNATVANGCVYIVSRLKDAGIVENTGNVQQMFFGLNNEQNQQLLLFEQLARDAGIEATCSGRITEIVWEKFIFISPTATATSFFDKTIGELLASNECVQQLTALIEEVKQLALVKQIPVPGNITETVLNKLRALPAAATSSMHSDFRNEHPQTELSTLTGYVLSEADRYGLLLPVYQKMYEVLKDR